MSKQAGPSATQVSSLPLTQPPSIQKKKKTWREQHHGGGRGQRPRHDTTTATATRMIGRLARGVRRGDPGRTEGDTGKWAATRSMIRGDGTRPRLPAWIFVPSSPPYLSPPAWIFPDSLRIMHCDPGAAGAYTATPDRPRVWP